MAIYIFIYLLFTILLFLQSKNYRKNNSDLITVLCIVLLCFISGTRYEMGGTDYEIYKYIFDRYNSIKDILIDLNNHTLQYEPGYAIFNVFIKNLGFNFYGFTLIHSILFYLCLYYGLRRYIGNFYILLLVFLYKLFFYNTFISLRQSITIAIFFVAFHLIEEKKPFKYLALSALAIPFHSGAFLLPLIYLINYFKLSRTRLVVLICIFTPTIIFSILNINILGSFSFLLNSLNNDTTLTKASNLIENNSLAGLGVFHTLEYLLLMICVIKNYDEIIKCNKSAVFILKLFLLLLPLFTLFRGYEILTREKDYFTFTYAVILWYITLIKNGRYKVSTYILASIICGFGFFRFIILFDNGGMVPYISWITMPEISIWTY